MPTPEREFYARAFALAGLFVLAYLLYLLLAPFFGPIAWALFIAFLIQPVHRWLALRLGGRATVSAILLTIATFVIVVGPLTGLGAAFAKQVAELARVVQQFVAEHRPTAATDLASLPYVGAGLAWLEENAGISFAQ